MWIEFVLAVLAAGAIADCFLHGEIFEVFRGLLNNRFLPADTDGVAVDEAPEVDNTISLPIPRWIVVLDRLTPDFFARAWTCPYCIQFHAVALTLAVISLSWLSAAFAGKSWEIASITLKVPVYWLAGARLMQIQDALMPVDYKFARKDDFDV